MLQTYQFCFFENAWAILTNGSEIGFDDSMISIVSGFSFAPQTVDNNTLNFSIGSWLSGNQSEGINIVVRHAL